MRRHICQNAPVRHQILQDFRPVEQAVPVGRVLAHLELALPDKAGDEATCILCQQGIRPIAKLTIQPIGNSCIDPPFSSDESIRDPAGAPGSVHRRRGRVVTVAARGGSHHDALREASVQPAAEQPRITIGKDTLSTGLADVRLQLTGDAVRWDLADLSAKECVAGAKEGLLEPIDYGIVNAEGIDPRLVRDDRVGFLYGS